MTNVAAGIVLLACLVIGGHAWIVDVGCAIPDAAAASNPLWGADARLIIYILAWVARALRDGGYGLFDPPVGYPAPRVLTGSEHFIGAQALFMPLEGVTGNIVLAANLTVLASYWLAGMLMFVLLRRYGCRFLPAMAGGLVNAFGPCHPIVGVHTSAKGIQPASALAMRLAYGPVTVQSMRALVDMAHLGWIVLPPRTSSQPDEQWSRLPGVVPAARLSDGRVFSVPIPPRFRWFSALSEGLNPDRTLLGTPLSRVTDPRARITATTVARQVAPSARLGVTIRVRNVGSSPWPALPFGPHDRRPVDLEVRWRESASVQRIALPYDIEPGEIVDVQVRLDAPSTPGTYALVVTAQQDGTVFPEPSPDLSVVVR